MIKSCGLLLLQKRSGFGLEKAEDGVGADERFEFRVFLSIEGALGILVRQMIIAGLRLVIRFQTQESMSQLHAQIATQRP